MYILLNSNQTIFYLKNWTLCHTLFMANILGTNRGAFGIMDASWEH